MDKEVGTGSRGTVAQTPPIAQVADLFEKGRYLYSTRSAEAFEARIRTTGEKVILWNLRFPLPPQGEYALRFVERLKRISALSPCVLSYVTFGVDSRGSAYLATEFVECRNPFEQNISAALAERVFITIINALAPLHLNGILLSDICLDTFQLDEKGDLVLLGILGSFDAAARETSLLPPIETLQFLAPEQRGGTGAEIASDVYALGVYAYRLFTGRFLQGSKAEMLPSVGPEDPTMAAPAPSAVNKDVPNWADDVIGRCLDPQPGNRFRDAADLADVIMKSIQSGTPPGGDHRWSRRTVAPLNDSAQKQKAKVLTGNRMQRDAEEGNGAEEQRVERNAVTPYTRSAPPGKVKSRKKKSSISFLRTGVFAIAAILLGGGGYFMIDRFNKSTAPIQDEIIAAAEYAPADLKPIIFDLATPGIPMDKRIAALTKIGEHEDAIAFAVLQTVHKGNYDPFLKSKAQELIVARLRRLGGDRTAEVVSLWFNTVSSSQKNPVEQPLYPLIMRAVDRAKPAQGRAQALQDAYKIDPLVGLQMTAAIALDENQENFISLLRQLLVLETPGVDFAGRGIGALVLSNSTLSMFYDHRLQELVSRFSDEDLKWTLQRLASYDSPIIVDLSKELLRRKAIPPFQSVFLDIIVDPSKTVSAKPLYKALVRGALGTLTADDIDQFGRWLSLDVEPVLLAACAVLTDKALELRAFDTLSGRTIQKEPAQSLITWIKTRNWEVRDRLIKSVGILGLLEIATDEDVEFAFGPLLQFAPGASVIRVLMATKEPRILRMTLDKFGELMPSDELLKLLANKNKYVRIESIKALKGRNELEVLQGILREYNREQDDEVKAVYKENHWVTQNREKAGVAPQQ